MKKLFLTIVTVLTISSINAQKFGVKAGLNIASLNITDPSRDTYDLKPKYGFNIGVFAEFDFSDKLSFQPELLFSTQGVNYNAYSIKVIKKYNYINMPLMAKYAINRSFNIQVGPQIGFLLSADQENTTTFNGRSYTYKGDIKNFLNTLDFDVSVGFGYKMNNGLSFDGRYNLGLTKLIKEPANFGNTQEKNRVFVFSIAYLFN